MEIVIKIIQKISVKQEINKVLLFLKNLKNIELYEPKITSIKLLKETDNIGVYHAIGKFLGLPWQGKFNYELHDNGFHSAMIEGLLANKMQGGFSVKSITPNECLITHYEEYILPVWAVIIKPLLYLYLHQAMIKELKNLSNLLK